MVVKVINGFGDKTTGDTYESQIKREPGEIFECDDKLAKERIKKGFVIENICTEDTKVDDIQSDNKDKELPYSEYQEIAKSKGLKYVGVSKENLIKSINECN